MILNHYSLFDPKIVSELHPSQPSRNPRFRIYFWQHLNRLQTGPQLDEPIPDELLRFQLLVSYLHQNYTLITCNIIQNNPHCKLNDFNIIKLPRIWLIFFIGFKPQRQKASVLMSNYQLKKLYQLNKS